MDKHKDEHNEGADFVDPVKLAVEVEWLMQELERRGGSFPLLSGDKARPKKEKRSKRKKK